MIKNTMRLFFHSVDRDIEALEAMEAPESILAKLRGMQDTVRSKWASIYSNEKHGNANTIQDYLDLNIAVNDAYNKIVLERSDYLVDNKIELAEPVDEYILSELFLSYTIFLDALSECGFYYVMCANFPVESMAWFAQQKQMREANRLLGEDNG
jgi:hypothetical protein